MWFFVISHRFQLYGESAALRLRFELQVSPVASQNGSGYIQPQAASGSSCLKRLEERFGIGDPRARIFKSYDHLLRFSSHGDIQQSKGFQLHCAMAVLNQIQERLKEPVRLS